MAINLFTNDNHDLEIKCSASSFYEMLKTVELVVSCFSNMDKVHGVRSLIVAAIY